MNKKASDIRAAQKEKQTVHSPSVDNFGLIFLIFFLNNILSRRTGKSYLFSTKTIANPIEDITLIKKKLAVQVKNIFIIIQVI